MAHNPMVSDLGIAMNLRTVGRERELETLIGRAHPVGGGLVPNGAPERRSRHGQDPSGPRAVAGPAERRRRAASPGAMLLGATVPFGLWAEAFEGHLRGLPPDRVRSLCGGSADDLAALLRSAAVATGGGGGEPPRARLLESLAVLLANIAEAAPVVVVLDDAHLADASSWEALHYCARNLRSTPVLVVVTARPAELRGQPGALQVLFGLEQDGDLARLDLRPLGPDGVRDLAEAVIGVPPPPPLVAWLDERARGNPLFVLGLLQALQEEGGDLATPRLRRLPEGLTDRVTARLGPLSGPARAHARFAGRRGPPSELRRTGAPHRASGRRARAGPRRPGPGPADYR